jgi:hypothetical protein
MQVGIFDLVDDDVKGRDHHWNVLGDYRFRCVQIFHLFTGWRYHQPIPKDRSFNPGATTGVGSYLLHAAVRALFCKCQGTYSFLLQCMTTMVRALHYISTALPTCMILVHCPPPG